MAPSICRVKFVFIVSQRVMSKKGSVILGGKAEGQWISGVPFLFQCHCCRGLLPCVFCSNPSLFPYVSKDYVLK